MRRKSANHQAARRIFAGRPPAAVLVRRTQRFGGQPRPTAKPLMNIDSNHFARELRVESRTVGKPLTR